MREDAVDVLRDDFIDGFWRVIKRGSGGHDERASVVKAQHVFDVDAIERRFAEAEDQFAALFEANVSSAGEQVVAHAGSNRPKRARGTGNDDHGVDGGAAGGDGGADVAIGQAFEFFRRSFGKKRGELLRILGDDAEFGGDEAQTGVAGDEVNAGDARIGVKGAKNRLRIDRAARAGDAYGDGFGFGGHCGRLAGV